MSSHTDNLVMVIVDEKPLRREAYAALFSGWASDHNLDVVCHAFGTKTSPAREIAMIVISAGNMSVTELRLRGELTHVLAGGPAAVVISDRDDPAEIAAAMILGIRGFLPTVLTAELARKTLTFILSGGDFFPSSALQPRFHSPLAQPWLDEPE